MFIAWMMIPIVVVAAIILFVVGIMMIVKNWKAQEQIIKNSDDENGESEGAESDMDGVSCDVALENLYNEYWDKERELMNGDLSTKRDEIEKVGKRLVVGQLLAATGWMVLVVGGLCLPLYFHDTPTRGYFEENSFLSPYVLWISAWFVILYLGIKSFRIERKAWLIITQIATPIAVVFAVNVMVATAFNIVAATILGMAGLILIVACFNEAISRSPYFESEGKTRGTVYCGIGLAVFALLVLFLDWWASIAPV